MKRMLFALALAAMLTASACALDRGGNIFGNNDWYGAEQAAKLSGDEPILLDADGTIMPQTQVDETQTDIREFFLVNDEIGGLVARNWTDAEATLGRTARTGHSIALKKDGTVVMAGAYTSYDR